MKDIIRMKQLAGIYTVGQARKLLEVLDTIKRTTPQKYVLLIWDVNMNERNPDLKMVFTSNIESNLDIPKGELADIIQNELGGTISVNDFEVEGPMSYNDFLDEYGNNDNPNKVTLDPKLIYGIDENV